MFFCLSIPRFFCFPFLIKGICSVDLPESLVWLANPFNWRLLQLHRFNLGGIKNKIINHTKRMVLTPIHHLWNNNCNVRSNFLTKFLYCNVMSLMSWCTHAKEFANNNRGNVWLHKISNFLNLCKKIQIFNCVRSVGSTIFVEWDATAKRSVNILHYENRRTEQMVSSMDQQMDVWQPLRVNFIRKYYEGPGRLCSSSIAHNFIFSYSWQEIEYIDTIRVW